MLTCVYELYTDSSYLHIIIIRYNISTAEYDGWSGSVNSSIARVNNVRVLDGDTENGNPTVRRKAVSELSDVYEQFGFSSKEAAEVGRRSLF